MLSLNHDNGSVLGSNAFQGRHLLFSTGFSSVNSNIGISETEKCTVEEDQTDAPSPAVVILDVSTAKSNAPTAKSNAPTFHPGDKELVDSKYGTVENGWFKFWPIMLAGVVMIVVVAIVLICMASRRRRNKKKKAARAQDAVEGLTVDSSFASFGLRVPLFSLISKASTAGDPPEMDPLRQDRNRNERTVPTRSRVMNSVRMMDEESRDPLSELGANRRTGNEDATNAPTRNGVSNGGPNSSATVFDNEATMQDPIQAHPIQETYGPTSGRLNRTHNRMVHALPIEDNYRTTATRINQSMQYSEPGYFGTTNKTDSKMIVAQAQPIHQYFHQGEMVNTVKSLQRQQHHHQQQQQHPYQQHQRQFQAGDGVSNRYANVGENVMGQEPHYQASSSQFQHANIPVQSNLEQSEDFFDFDNPSQKAEQDIQAAKAFLVRKGSVGSSDEEVNRSYHSRKLARRQLELVTGDSTLTGDRPSRRQTADTSQTAGSRVSKVGFRSRNRRHSTADTFNAAGTTPAAKASSRPQDWRPTMDMSHAVDSRKPESSRRKSMDVSLLAIDRRLGAGTPTAKASSCPPDWRPTMDMSHAVGSRTTESSRSGNRRRSMDVSLAIESRLSKAGSRSRRQTLDTSYPIDSRMSSSLHGTKQMSDNNSRMVTSLRGKRQTGGNTNALDSRMASSLHSTRQTGETTKTDPKCSTLSSNPSRMRTMISKQSPKDPLSGGRRGPIDSSTRSRPSPAELKSSKATQMRSTKAKTLAKAAKRSTMDFSSAVRDIPPFSSADRKNPSKRTSNVEPSYRAPEIGTMCDDISVLSGLTDLGPLEIGTVCDDSTVISGLTDLGPSYHRVSFTSNRQGILSPSQHKEEHYGDYTFDTIPIEGVATQLSDGRSNTIIDSNRRQSIKASDMSEGTRHSSSNHSTIYGRKMNDTSEGTTSSRRSSMNYTTSTSRRKTITGTTEFQPTPHEPRGVDVPHPIQPVSPPRRQLSCASHIGVTRNRRSIDPLDRHRMDKEMQNRNLPAAPSYRIMRRGHAT